MCTFEDAKEQLGTFLTKYEENEKVATDIKFSDFKPKHVITSLYSASECVVLGVSSILLTVSLIISIGYGLAAILNKSAASSNIVSSLLFLFFTCIFTGIYGGVKHITNQRINSYLHKRDYTISESVRPFKFSYKAYGREIVDNGKGVLFLQVPKRFSFWRTTAEWHQCGLVNYETGRVVMQIPLSYIAQNSREYITVINAYRQANNLD